MRFMCNILFYISITGCALDLRDTKNRVIGSIQVRLETKPSGPLNPSTVTVRSDVTRLQSAVLTAELDRSSRIGASPTVQIAKATRAIAGQILDNGLEQLESVTAKLEKLLKNLEPVMTVMDEASKVNFLLYLISIYKSLILPCSGSSLRSGRMECCLIAL